MRTWSRVRSVTPVSDIVRWSVVEFSSGVEVYDTFAIERARRALNYVVDVVRVVDFIMWEILTSQK